MLIIYQISIRHHSNNIMLIIIKDHCYQILIMVQQIYQ